MNSIEHPSDKASVIAQKPKSRKKLIILAIIAFLIILAVGIYFWVNRPIKPVILSDGEQRALDTKIEAVQAPEERTYEKGDKILELTEREVNALFHHNTGLGEKVRFELATNAVHARVITDLDPDMPILGGRTLKARARLLVTDQNDNPAIILDDLTLWGISLPNSWLANMKGQNLLSSLGVENTSGPVSKGIKRIEITNGKILIELAE